MKVAQRDKIHSYHHHANDDIYSVQEIPNINSPPPCHGRPPTAKQLARSGNTDLWHMIITDRLALFFIKGVKKRTAPYDGSQNQNIFLLANCSFKWNILK